MFAGVAPVTGGAMAVVAGSVARWNACLTARSRTIIWKPIIPLEAHAVAVRIAAFQAGRWTHAID